LAASAGEGEKASLFARTAAGVYRLDGIDAHPPTTVGTAAAAS
jgi:hypothetical protein